MVVQIAGKVRRSGTSRKTGNTYDFGVIYFLAPARGVEGRAAYEKLIDLGQIDFDKLLVNQHYELELDLNGNITNLIPAKV